MLARLAQAFTRPCAARRVAMDQPLPALQRADATQSQRQMAARPDGTGRGRAGVVQRCARSRSTQAGTKAVAAPNSLAANPYPPAVPEGSRLSSSVSAPAALASWTKPAAG